MGIRNKLDGQKSGAKTEMHYITLKSLYSGLSKSNFKDHYGDATRGQCLGMTAEINVFSASGEML